MANILAFKGEAREKILKGVETVYEAVASTLGPKATNVAADRDFGAPMVVHDGVTVAKWVERLKDPFENMGAQLVKQAAEKTNDAVGDGTTTSIVLAHALLSSAHRNITAGANPMMIRRGIEKAVEALINELDAAAIPLKGSDDVRQIASISAQDAEIGELVATAVEKMGPEGIITVEETGSSQMSIDYKEGMQFDKGYVSRYFITDPASEEAVIENPFILVTDRRINELKEFVEFIDPFFKNDNNDLVIICESMDDQPLIVLINNKQMGTIRTLVVTAPGFGDQRKAVLEDIATVTGATFVSQEMGQRLNSLTIDDLGRAKKIIATKDSTLIVGGEGGKETVETRLASLRQGLEKEKSDFEKERIQERIAKITSGIAIINVGASSEVEMREKKERVIDAISATKAAKEGGVVPGGETALLRASRALNDLAFAEEGLNEQEKVGVNIVREAIEQPFRRLMENAGYDPGQMRERLEEAFNKAKLENAGIDVIDGKVKNLVKSGVIDPAKVTKSALKNAASVAIMLMTTNVLISKEPDQPKNES